ncbi:redoxin domain-containing protein [bacterium]|nr:redoxin domain-containing protein [bacterium]
MPQQKISQQEISQQERDLHALTGQAVTLQDKRRWQFLMAATLLLGVLWIGYSRVPLTLTADQRVESPQVGFLAPDFELGLTDGDTVQLSALRGKPVIINFWATWCGPCRDEMPALEQVWQRYGKGDVMLLGVNQGEDLPTITAFAHGEMGVSFPLLLDSQMDVSRLYNIRAMPTTFFVDVNGRIQDIQIGGPLDQAALLAGIEKARHP